jgi:hypothetical protein
MLIKKKILIIGSSYSIKKTFSDIYNDKYKIDYINFRETWRNPKSINRYEIIIVSGFHFFICYLSLASLGNYINKYIKYLNSIKAKCTKVILITTFINSKKSLSRVVYFYYNLLLTLKNRSLLKKFNILTFRKIHFIKNNIFYKIFLKKILESKFLQFNQVDCFKKKINKYKLKKIQKINFIFIKFPRTRLIDRVLRLI